MKRRWLLVSGILLIIFLLITSFYYMFFYHLTEDQYSKIMCYYIARKLTSGLSSFNEKVNALRDFVHDNVHPVSGYYCRPDTVAIEKLLSGIGWCDQQVRVFMQLAHNVGITSRLAFLRQDSGSSPHTVAEVLAPDNRWVITDVGNKLDLVKENGDPASQSDIKKDLTILSDNKKIKLRSAFRKRWTDKKYLAIYYNEPQYIVTKTAMRFDYLKKVPISWLRPIVTFIQNGLLDKFDKSIIDKYEFKWLKARGYHLLDYYERSAKLYREIIEKSSNLQLVRKAEYYYSALLKDQKRYEEAYRYLTDIIDKADTGSKEDIATSYLAYLYGLRAFVLEEMGRDEEAEQDLFKIGYSLDAGY